MYFFRRGAGVWKRGIGSVSTFAAGCVTPGSHSSISVAFSCNETNQSDICNMSSVKASERNCAFRWWKSERLLRILPNSNLFKCFHWALAKNKNYSRCPKAVGSFLSLQQCLDIHIIMQRQRECASDWNKPYVWYTQCCQMWYVRISYQSAKINDKAKLHENLQVQESEFKMKMEFRGPLSICRLYCLLKCFGDKISNFIVNAVFTVCGTTRETLKVADKVLLLLPALMQ